MVTKGRQTSWPQNLISRDNVLHFRNCCINVINTCMIAFITFRQDTGLNSLPPPFFFFKVGVNLPSQVIVTQTKDCNYRSITCIAIVTYRITACESFNISTDLSRNTNTHNISAITRKANNSDVFRMMYRNRSCPLGK